MKLKGIELEPGMIIETIDEGYIVFPMKNPDTPWGFACINSGGWTSKINEKDIIKIFGLPTNGVLYSGDVLWDKDQPIEISMGEIAEKFNIPVEMLRIKK